MDETALDVLTRAATLVETDAANKLAGEGDKAAVHPVDFSSNIHSSGLSNCPYDQLSGPRGLRLKRRPERKPSEVSKRCLTEKLQQMERCIDSKENVASYDYLSDTASEDQLSDEDTGKLVVDDNVDSEIIENNDSTDITKSPLSSSGHFNPAVVSAGDVGEDSRGGGLRVEKDTGVRLVVEARRTDEERDEEDLRSKHENLGVDDDHSLEDEDSQIDGKEDEEQDGPLDMTTNNRSRNGIGGNPPRWSPSSSPTPLANLSSIFYPHHPPRYNPYVTTAPPPYHAMPQHHLSSRPHSASPPPYLPPSYISPNLFGESNGHRNAPLRPAHTVQQQHRPSVITCANTTSSRGSPPPPPLPSHHPPHHHHHSQHHHKAQSLALNHHRNCLPSAGPNDLSSTNSGLGMINRRTLSDPTAGRINSSGSGNGGGSLFKSRRSSDHGRVGHRRELLSGMCDPVIDEHFRRSLGKDYPEYLSSSVSNKTSQNNYKSLPTVGSANSSPSANSSSTSSVSITGMSVDDHFAKALGETWLRLQSKGIPSSSNPASPIVTAGGSPSSKPSSPTISLGSGYVSNSMSPKSVSPSPAVQQRQSIVST